MKRFVAAIGVFFASVAMATAAPPTFHGGSVISTQPHVYLVEWGSQWAGNDPSAEVPRLQRFFSGLGGKGDTWSPVLREYGIAPSSGVYAGTIVDPGIPAPVDPVQQEMATEAEWASSQVPDDPGNIFVVMTPRGVRPDGFPTDWCGFHSAFGGRTAWVAMPYMTDGGAGCGARYMGSPFDGITYVASHEYAETLTDPLGDGWYSPDDGEVGDNCAWWPGSMGGNDVTLMTGRFAVAALELPDGSCLSQITTPKRHVVKKHRRTRRRHVVTKRHRARR